MCGFAGLVNLDAAPINVPRLVEAGRALAHRGPDGEGLWTEGPVGIVHRRLSIIDLSPAGAQPMLSADHRHVLAYNGEIYNFRELRAELEAEGYWFRSSCDTEVVLNALSAWGVDALGRFNGMFALALWDRRERSLLLARDRYGIKPLYYGTVGGGFTFASEQKALLRSLERAGSINVPALLEYFTFQNLFTDQTLQRDIQILPAGYYGYLRPDDASPRIKLVRYWDFRFDDTSQDVDAREYAEELERLFSQAVTRQLVSDVPVGGYLSGGLDSGAITSVAASAVSNYRTFTCGFDLSSASGIELSFDERGKAEAMSALFGTQHYQVVLKAGDMERAFPALARAVEEPRVGQSYPNYYAAELAGKFVKVVLSGAGGDELFGGYPWRYYRAASASSFESYVGRYFDAWQRLLTSAELDRLFRPVRNDVVHVDTRQIFRDVFANHKTVLERPEDYINHSLYFEAKTFLHGLLVVEDKLSMAHGLETRLPFLDNDLVDFAMRCPVRLKLNRLDEAMRINENESGDKRERYFLRTNDGKQILRTVAGKRVPSDVAQAVKQGFSAPDASWFKGASMDYVRSRLLTGSPRIYDYLDRKTVHSLVSEHLEGRNNRRLFIWSLLSFEHYLHAYA